MLQGCVSQNTKIFRNVYLDKLIVQEIKYFSELKNYKNVEVIQKKDTLILLNYKNVALNLDQQLCTYYNGFNIIVDKNSDEDILKLKQTEICPQPNVNAGIYDEEIYGVVYTKDLKGKNFKEVVRGDYNVVSPYLDNIQIRKVPMDEPKKVINIATPNE